MINFFVLDENFKKIGIINKYYDLLWIYPFAELGSCTLVTPPDKTSKLFKLGRYILKSDDNDVMRIHTIKTTYSQTEGEKIEIQGHALAAILSQRINNKILNFNTTQPAEIITTLINGNFNQQGERFLPVECDVSEIIGEEFKMDGYQDSYGNILTIINEFCLTYGFRYRMRCLEDRFKLKFYRCRDVTDKVRYDYRLNNIHNAQEIKSALQYKTVALVAGAGEGNARKKVWVNNDENLTGINRHEVYVDARDITDTTESGEIIEETTYNNMLKTRGIAKLKENNLVDIIDVDVNTDKVKPLVDYLEGDIINLNISGERQEKRVKAINLYLNNGRLNYGVDFGEDMTY